jgi:SAM-dependent methyltransferase
MGARLGGPDYYDRAGQGYAEQRRPDPRIAAVLAAALGHARSVVNVGAGPGSYEPSDRPVVAVEPSAVMLAQRTSDAPRVRAVSETLPFGDDTFEAAMAVLTVHHWSDWRRGLSELGRVARRVVVLTFDTDAEPPFWLFDYFPRILERDRLRMPPIGEVCALLNARATPLPVPHDCTDGFLGAYWRTPARYLDERIRSAMSGFAMLSEEELAQGLRRLESDLVSGAWAARYGWLLGLDTTDLGYRVVVASRS